MTSAGGGVCQKLTCRQIFKTRNIEVLRASVLLNRNYLSNYLTFPLLYKPASSFISSKKKKKEKEKRKTQNAVFHSQIYSHFSLLSMRSYKTPEASAEKICAPSGKKKGSTQFNFFPRGIFLS